MKRVLRMFMLSALILACALVPDRGVYAGETEVVPYMFMTQKDIEVGTTWDLKEAYFSYMIDEYEHATRRTGKKFTFTSGDENVVSIDENGVLTAVDEGTARVTVTEEGGKESGGFTVNVVSVQYSNNATVQALRKETGELLELTSTDKLNATNRYSLLTRIVTFLKKGQQFAKSIGKTSVNPTTGNMMLLDLHSQMNVPNYDMVADNEASYLRIYGNQFNPYASKGKYIFNVKSVTATPHQVTVTLKKPITKDQVFGLIMKQDDLSTVKLTGENSAEVQLRMLSAKYDTYNMTGTAKVGSNTIVFTNIKDGWGKKAAIKTGSYRVWDWPRSYKCSVKKAAGKGDSVTLGNLSVKLLSGGKAEVKAKNSKITNVTIPAAIQYDGKTYKVTKVADNGFKNCKKLKSIRIESTKLSFGKNAFKGVKKASVTVPSSKLAAYKKAMKKAGLGSKSSFAAG
ncbi:MAG: Ig-like domain-containing protein [Lachnospiraceae bacterium]|nr:Ig-like domain-containing protein [Lachnospiraceae bacterium]